VIAARGLHIGARVDFRVEITRVSTQGWRGGPGERDARHRGGSNGAFARICGHLRTLDATRAPSVTLLGREAPDRVAHAAALDCRFRRNNVAVGRGPSPRASLFRWERVFDAVADLA
jgi:hypothetical protein